MTSKTKYTFIKTQNHKIIFGLKVRQLRTARKLTFEDLSIKTKMSISYLNEIEKGKKYPKADKIKKLSVALGVEKEELESLDLPQQLAPLSELLQSNFLSELPLDLFGIELSKVTEIIANAPIRVGAFISTLVEISRNYSLVDAHFFAGAMRSYQEMRLNYFEEIEEAAMAFVEKNTSLKPSQVTLQSGQVTLEMLEDILQKKYKYKIIDDGLDKYPHLTKLRYVYSPKDKKLLLNSNLTKAEKFLQVGKEIGFNVLKIKERAYTSKLLEMESFEKVLNHYRTSYFTAALLLPRDAFVKDIGEFFQKEKWDAEAFLALKKKYNASPVVFFHRLTNLLSQFFGLKKMFFLRCAHNVMSGGFSIVNELHLNHKHHPHGNGLLEHYCRRWLSISLLNEMQEMQQAGKYTGTFVGVQRSKYFGTDDEYISFTLARPSYPEPHQNTSVTIGILIDEELSGKIKFLNDSTIPSKEVNKTCERCVIQDCGERAAPAKIIEQNKKRKAMRDVLKELLRE